ncbi:MAG TPA: NlpC/P60 family protein [Mycobacteriales bacterium]|nr:NlpC/P60 family protein [Mycobacteriales bacterium]
MYRARHARPSATRQVVGTSVGAALLPLALAAPAAAEDSAAKASTEVRFAAPASSQSSTVPVSVRLLANDQPVEDGRVNLEKYTGSGWTYAGRLLTNADGTASGRLKITQNTKLRARYVGTTTRTPATSPAKAVAVRKGSSSSSAGSTNSSDNSVSASSRGSKAVQIASQQRGKPYRYGAVGPNSFDCSGLVKYVYGRLGRNLPHNSAAQANSTRRISSSAKAPGDLIFVRSGGRITHVGIYAGSGRFWVAPRSGTVVKLQQIYTSNYSVGRV